MSGNKNFIPPHRLVESMRGLSLVEKFDRQVWEETFRQVHTMKAHASIGGAKTFARIIHAYENRLLDMRYESYDDLGKFISEVLNFIECYLMALSEENLRF